MSRNKHEEKLFHLLQDIYFDNIDTAKADEASALAVSILSK